LPVQLIAHSATEARIENGMDLAIGRPSSTRQDESKLNTACSSRIDGAMTSKH